jgi:penicillin-binding protein 2
LESLTGVDIPGEIAGLVPDPGWKMEKKQEKWFLGDTYNVSIGQGDLAVTPLEMERAAIALSNGGKLCIPHVLQSKGDSCTDLKIDPKNLKQVQKGMEGACSQGGTAFPFFDFYGRSNIKVACKTGTAQNVHEDPHAWFIAYAPSDDPQIVITVLVENGGEGSEAAAPIARKIFDYYFNVPEKASPTPTSTPTP